MGYDRERFNKRPVPAGRDRSVQQQLDDLRAYLAQELSNIQRGIPWSDVIDVRDFGATSGSGDQTARIQAAINALGPNGGLVIVPRGTTFALGDLVFPIRCTLDYFADDNTTPNGGGVTTATNERIRF